MQKDNEGSGHENRAGNAVVAAVTAAAVLNVVEPEMTGPGGDMFAIRWSEQEQRLVGRRFNPRTVEHSSYSS